MATPLMQKSFAAGEVTPSLFGHVDLTRYQTGAATMRNLFVSYRGGAYSRAGTAFSGVSKQTGRSYPPRLIPFQFSENQGLALEFGNGYMRVIFEGAYVTESGVNITGISQANPAVLTVAAASGAKTVSPNIAGVYQSYAPGDISTLAGGTYSQPAMVQINTTTLHSLALGAPGKGYAPGDTINLSGGVQSVPASLTVTDTQVVSATIANGGSGGTNGPATVTGTTGTGTKFQASVTISGGAITAVNSITVPGDYTVNPANISAEPVTGGGLVGATLNLTMGLEAFSITSAGTFTTNGSLAQSTTSGLGIGASFQSPVFAPAGVTLSQAGVYSAFPPNPVAEASTTGSGLGATYNLTNGAAANYSTGDWVEISGVLGMTQLNQRTVVLGAAVGGGFALQDPFGNPIDSTAFSAYTGGGVASRVYTLTTPYAEQDLPYLKFTQSADVMSLCCVNQQTQTEYPPLDLTRFSDSNWKLASIDQPNVSPPVVTNVTISTPLVVSGETIQFDTFYEYVVTAVNPKTQSESIASNIGQLAGQFDISVVSGTTRVSWNAVPNVTQYYVYKATPSYEAFQPAGSLFGRIGTCFGTTFADNDYVPDFGNVPPTHVNPFARGAIQAINVVAGGKKYGNVSTTATINTATGSGAQSIAIVNNSVQGFIVSEAGENYQPTDTVTVQGVGVGAVASLVVGPESGTYPSVVAYFQQRRFYASTINQPDTFFASKPGDFTNFDSRVPTVDTDAIIGNPWSVQVNGIQFMVPMPGGLVVLTGNSAWQLTGSGGSSLNPQPITPSAEQAQPQAFNGCSATVPPIKIDYDIIYVQSKGSIYRDLSYNFYSNIYTGADLTLTSSHLFNNFKIIEHAYCEEPFKVIWGVRDDGCLLSLTFVKPEQVQGWARHDTNGRFKSVCTITEPPVDALYVAVERQIGGQTVYFVERMDDRYWATAEDAWCVDAGLSTALPTPAASLTVDLPNGLGGISGVTNLVGGSGYGPNTTARIIDDNGQGTGTGANPVLTIANGVITAITFPSGEGSGYTFPQIEFDDPSNQGTGASATLVLDNSATFTASAPVFGPGSIGGVIRMGGGIATVTAFIDTEHVTATINSPIVAVQPNSNPPYVPAQPAGTWTLAMPLQTARGLYHLIGETVTGLADGNVVSPRVVAADGSVQLDEPATLITLGLGFQAQFQSVYIETGEPTTQGQRKKTSEVTARMEASRGVLIGANQVDGSTQSPPSLAPTWRDMEPLPDKARSPYNGLCKPLYTGDARTAVPSGWNVRGQIAMQQNNPLPMQILAVIPEDLMGDTPEQMAKQKRGQQ